MIDVVYTLGTGSRWDNREIIFSLRSFERHLGKLGKVWIVGHLPDFLQGIEHIPFPDPYKENKDANKINKVLRACAEPALSERFVWCSDDQCLLADADAGSFGPCCVEQLEDVTSWGDSHWVQRLKNTHERLLLSRFTTFNLEAHTPLLIAKDTFPNTMLRFDYGAGYGYNLATLYYNALGVGGRPREAADLRAGFFLEEDLGSEAIEARVEAKQFLAYNDAGLNPSLKSFLADRFPKPSRYER